MRLIEVVEFIESRPIITSNDVSKNFNISKTYARIFLQRLFKRGLVRRIEKGKYSYVNDALVIACNIVYPSYISFFTAASIKGYTEQLPRTIQLATTVYKRDITFDENKIEFINLPSWGFYGYLKQMRNNFAIFIVEDEKLIIDILLKPKTIGNFEEIVEIIKNIKVQEEKIKEYAKRIKNVSLLKRLGYLLEEYKNIDLSDVVSIRDRNYINLNPFGKLGKNINKKWRIKYD
ncbi:MAG: hypothetical protein HA495_07755 [Thaumarchaeota archaeon]|jgi:predicted transcriptional regulator of viral defense system|nr:hypothetical protein [Nitrososphaerota archaeon]